MPIFLYVCPTTPEYCWEAESLPTDMELNKVFARVEPQGVCGVAVEARNVKEARRIAKGLIATRMSEVNPK